MNRNRRKRRIQERPIHYAYIFLAIIAGVFLFAAIAQATPERPAEAKEATAEEIPADDSETTLTREEADVRDARNLEGRWATFYEVTPDHIDEEKVDDEISENFDLFCDVVYAENGNQGDKGLRLAADTIINRMRSGEAFADTLNGVLTAPSQFSCIADGHAAKFAGHERNEVRKICQEELAHTSNTQVFYFRTDYFSDYGTPLFKYKDVYYSGR